MPSFAKIHRRHGYGKDAHTYYPVLIVGAGESGVAMGCRLKEVLGTDQFRIFDHWSTIHPPAQEISQYLADVCEKYEIVDKIQFHTDVKQIRWVEEDEEWEVILSHLVPGTGDLAQHERDELAEKEGSHHVYIKNEMVRAKVVVSGVGGLVEPRVWPNDIPGIDEFEGEITHTARWNSDIDFKDKNVIVLGSGCSAAQVVPELAKKEANVRSITQLMRTAPWVQPDLLTPDQLRFWETKMPKLMRNIPGLGWFARNYVFWRAEGNWFSMFTDTDYSRKWRPRIQKRFLDGMLTCAPEEYHEILTPNYNLGCKRRIVEGVWYRSLNAPNVELTTQPLTRVHSRSVTLGPGSYLKSSKDDSGGEARDLPVDVIVLGNGFETNKWLHPLKVLGRENKSLQDIWDERGGAQAYLGIAMDHCPNFFMVHGPNTATGHSSVIFASENAVNYSLKFIKNILSGEVSSYEIKEDAERTWAQQVQDQLQKTVFKRGGCSSWYITENGWNSSTYP
ncbi:hypothetical protein N7478_006766 [Penicillium angulare]|uniref:uncharacterized protein n=1 Tax=Penicillium angulare TaxID=116970 RepID=UPI002541A83C|nr:uncharacterized protein N7478_006766 [Penicillium angulare]KAJ5281394.1 hypothetical protein N7478_006766 [Penicillium angulare]